MRLLRDLDLGALRGQHPDGNLQSPPGWIHDTDRPITPLRSAKDLEGSTMKRVEGVEDLNGRISCAQGIVGVGAIIHTCIASSPVVVSLATATVGSPAGLPSFCPSTCWPVCSAGCSCNTWNGHSMPAN